MKVFQGQKVLVAGGAGFVGSNLVKALLFSSPREILIVDNLLSSERSAIPDDPRVTFVHGSIAQDDILRRLPHDLDYAFHLATFHGNQNSIADPLADHENNTLTTLKLFDRLKGFKALKKVVYSSAGCTVADKTFEQAKATTEDAPVSLWLDSPYQISKIVGEFYGNFYYKQHGLPVVKARFQNVYGPGEILGAGAWRGTSATVWRNVIPTFIYRAIKGLPLQVENGGIATRDFIFVDDITRGLLLCAAKAPAGETYNLASGEETAILDLAKLVNELAGNVAAIQLAPKRGWDNSGKRFGSRDKAKQQLGFEAKLTLADGLDRTISWTSFEAKLTLADGLDRTISWTRQNLSLIEKCMAQHMPRMAA